MNTQGKQPCRGQVVCRAARLGPPVSCLPQRGQERRQGWKSPLHPRDNMLGCHCLPVAITAGRRVKGPSEGTAGLPPGNQPRRKWASVLQRPRNERGGGRRGPRSHVSGRVGHGSCVTSLPRHAANLWPRAVQHWAAKAAGSRHRAGAGPTAARGTSFTRKSNWCPVWDWPLAAGMVRAGPKAARELRPRVSDTSSPNATAGLCRF